MGVPGELVAEVELIDGLLKLEPGSKPLDRANVRVEAEGALRELLKLYERDEQARIEVRALLSRCDRFTWATGVPRGRAPHAFRRQLLLLSARDQGRDTRDEMVWLNDICAEAREAGVDIRPLLLEVAELSSTEDKYGMGSVRGILLRAAEHDPVGLW
ncbi:hypothetical protein OG866_12795 [Streptomyces sp. NBC_00663]|uniref:hypothetical protein n=1 Tax=Streptomyces sp. NBC_00663 TaxID=2975801 RepID=UPI002E359505|nr:hypothetical protein [Streptomyces sp. NBC_00663]